MRVAFLPLLTCLVASLLPASAALAQADLEGIWQPVDPINAHPTEDEFEYTPAGRAAMDEFSAENDPSFHCQMPGVPRGVIDPYPLEIIQQEHQIVFLYEYYHQVRRIYLDGREAPEFWPPTLGGFSTGSWEGETLVVHTTKLSPDNLMNVNGRPFSGAADTYVIERYTRRGDTLELEAVAHDPTNYVGRYEFGMEYKLDPEGQIWEYHCNPSFGDVG